MIMTDLPLTPLVSSPSPSIPQFCKDIYISTLNISNDLASTTLRIAQIPKEKFYAPTFLMSNPGFCIYFPLSMTLPHENISTFLKSLGILHFLNLKFFLIMLYRHKLSSMFCKDDFLIPGISRAASSNVSIFYGSHIQYMHFFPHHVNDKRGFVHVLDFFSPVCSLKSFHLTG